jgi:dihydroorotase
LKIHIKNGHLIDPKNNIDAKIDVFIAAGRVVGIGKAPDGFAANQTIDAAGLIVAPGFVDLSARLREPGSAHKANLKSELQAAAAGGVTSLACPPDTQPILDEPGLVEIAETSCQTTQFGTCISAGCADTPTTRQTLNRDERADRGGLCGI